MGVVYFNDIPSTDFGIEISSLPNFNAPTRVYDISHIPGRNGDFVLDGGSFNNLDVEYGFSLIPPYNWYRKDIRYHSGDIVKRDVGYFKCLASESSLYWVDSEWLYISDMDIMNSCYREMSKWLLLNPGYHKLTDSYDPDHFRYAVYNQQFHLDNFLNLAMAGTLTFNCQPERYLVSGDSPIEYDPASFGPRPLCQKISDRDADDTAKTRGLELPNPTVFDSCPIIKLYCTDDYAEYNTQKLYCRIGNFKPDVVDTRTMFIVSPGWTSPLYIDTKTANIYGENGENKSSMVSNFNFDDSVIHYNPEDNEKIFFFYGTETETPEYEGRKHVAFEVTPRWWEL